jgi:hypothetical protein
MSAEPRLTAISVREPGAVSPEDSGELCPTDEEDDEDEVLLVDEEGCSAGCEDLYEVGRGAIGMSSAWAGAAAAGD